MIFLKNNVQQKNSFEGTCVEQQNKSIPIKENKNEENKNKSQNKNYILVPYSKI